MKKVAVGEAACKPAYLSLAAIHAVRWTTKSRMKASEPLNSLLQDVYPELDVQQIAEVRARFARYIETALAVAQESEDAILTVPKITPSMKERSKTNLKT